MRVVQQPGTKGSQKWLQRAVVERWEALEAPILAKLPGNAAIKWRSPLRDDDFAEYRDGSFLRLLGLDRLELALAAFWPKRGPQWDALGVASGGQVLLVEAKSHLAEFCSPASGAGPASRQQIAASLDKVATTLGSSRGVLWPDLFYQFANRLAHLWFLRTEGVDAYLVLVGFLGDAEMGGPTSAEAWRAAYAVADYALGLSTRHALSRYVIHVCPTVPS